MMEAIEEDEEETFVFSSLRTACEEGSTSKVKDLLSSANNLDINAANKHGETLLHTAVYSGHKEVVQVLHEQGAKLDLVDKHGDTTAHIAARQGQLETLQYLATQGTSLNTTNLAAETPLHLACRYSHVEVIEYLCAKEVDVNIKDKLGDTPLHTACYHGAPPPALLALCKAGAYVDGGNREGETPLHAASGRGQLPAVRFMLGKKVDINKQDQRGNTPLHLACRRRHVQVALTLLHAECDLDKVDLLGESPLHVCAREGVLPLVQTMCSLGCELDISNKTGHTPLHLASRAGHIEVVRCLLLSGSATNLLNKEGVSAEVMAIAQGHTDVADLVSRMRPDKRESCVRQLLPGRQPLNRVKVKVFGDSGSGKTTLIDSLKCGYIGSFFRRSRGSVSLSSVTTDKEEADAENSLPDKKKLSPQNSIEVVHEQYTRGIAVEQANVSGAGDLSLWEFSGFEPYYQTYDLFIGDPNCIHIVTFDLSRPKEEQIRSILFWMGFLKARIPIMNPIAIYGKQPWPAKVALVGTHGDAVTCTKNDKGELTCSEAEMLLDNIRHKFHTDFDIWPTCFVVDAHLPMSTEFKAFRTYLNDSKMRITHNLPYPTDLLEAITQALATWRKLNPSSPVVTWPSFVEYVRSKVNLLASEEHLKEVMCQLQLTGEVIYVESPVSSDFVVLDPHWLGTSLLGQLLSSERLASCRPTGCFSREELGLTWLNAEETLPLLEALGLCVGCELEGTTEYEFPCYNFIETLQGLWAPEPRRLPSAVYCGVRLDPWGPGSLRHVFTRIQGALRRAAVVQEAADSDLYQWFQGSKFCLGPMEVMITLEERGIEVKARGPADMNVQCFELLQLVLHIVQSSLEDSCPGLALVQYTLSMQDMAQHCNTVRAYSPKEVLQLSQRPVENGDHHGNSPSNGDHHGNSPSNEETLPQLLCFDSPAVFSTLRLAPDLHISFLSPHARRAICSFLDPAEPMGRDWCVLAVKLGLTEALPELDTSPPPGYLPRSKTDRALEAWARSDEATVGNLADKLRDMGREDAGDALVSLAPLYVFTEENNNKKQMLEQQSQEQS